MADVPKSHNILELTSQTEISNMEAKVSSSVPPTASLSNAEKLRASAVLALTASNRRKGKIFDTSNSGHKSSSDEEENSSDDEKPAQGVSRHNFSSAKHRSLSNPPKAKSATAAAATKTSLKNSNKGAPLKDSNENRAVSSSIPSEESSSLSSPSTTTTSVQSRGDHKNESQTASPRAKFRNEPHRNSTGILDSEVLGSANKLSSARSSKSTSLKTSNSSSRDPIPPLVSSSSAASSPLKNAASPKKDAPSSTVDLSHRKNGAANPKNGAVKKNASTKSNSHPAKAGNKSSSVPSTIGTPTHIKALSAPMNETSASPLPVISPSNFEPPSTIWSPWDLLRRTGSKMNDPANLNNVQAIYQANLDTPKLPFFNFYSNRAKDDLKSLDEYLSRFPLSEKTGLPPFPHWENFCNCWPRFFDAVAQWWEKRYVKTIKVQESQNVWLNPGGREPAQFTDVPFLKVAYFLAVGIEEKESPANVLLLPAEERAENVFFGILERLNHWVFATICPTYDAFFANELDATIRERAFREKSACLAATRTEASNAKYNSIDPRYFLRLLNDEIADPLTGQKKKRASPAIPWDVAYRPPIDSTEAAQHVAIASIEAMKRSPQAMHNFLYMYCAFMNMLGITLGDVDGRLSRSECFKERSEKIFHARENGQGILVSVANWFIYWSRSLAALRLEKMQHNLTVFLQIELNATSDRILSLGEHQITVLRRLLYAYFDPSMAHVSGQRDCTWPQTVLGCYKTRRNYNMDAAPCERKCYPEARWGSHGLVKTKMRKPADPRKGPQGNVAASAPRPDIYLDVIERLFGECLRPGRPGIETEVAILYRWMQELGNHFFAEEVARISMQESQTLSGASLRS